MCVFISLVSRFLVMSLKGCWFSSFCSLHEKGSCEIVNRDEWVWSDNIRSLYLSHKYTHTHTLRGPVGVLPCGETTHCCKLEFVFRVAGARGSRTRSSSPKEQNTDLFFCWFSFSSLWTDKQEGGEMKLEREETRVGRCVEVWEVGLFRG